MSAKKIILSIVFLFGSFFIATAPTHAEDLGSGNFNYFIHGQTSIEGSMGHTAFCMLAGFSPFNKCAGYQYQKPPVLGDLLNKPQNPKIVLYDRIPNGGALGSIGSTMVAFYDNPPTSSTYYLANLGENIGLIPKPAYAQVIGSGEGIVHPIFQLWQASRNLAYIAFTLVFVVVGLMIMLRQKINPQTVISAQQAIPSLVIGLVLVTFSYFIAALIIDLAFIGIQLVTQLFLPQNLGIPNSLGNDQQLKDLAQNANIFQLFGTSALNGVNLDTAARGVSGQLNGTFGALAIIIPTVVGAIAGFLIGGPLGALFGTAAGAAGTTFVIPALLIIVLLIALTIQMFRLLFGLINSYIQILIFTLGGPFFILIGSIPGRGGTITMWWKGLLANALVFPAVFAVFLFAGVVIGANWSNATLPLFGQTSGDFLKALLAYGILLGSPSIPDMVRNALGVKGPQGFAQAAMGGLMSGVGVGQAGYNRLTAGPKQIQKAWEDNETKRQAGLGAPAVARPPRRFPWIY